MARLGRASDKDYMDAWSRYCQNFKDSTPVNLNETQTSKLKRIEYLESHPEEWFKYYFPKYCSSEPAQFHKDAAVRLLSNPEWFEVRSWSRELAKSARSMMEVCYLALTGQIKNFLLVSCTHESAEDLILPFKAFFEANQRVEFDYGKQEQIGNWKVDKFVIQKGCSFRAIGANESPRGTRNNEKRPDFILLDDFDTDKECRNEEIITNKIRWIEQALIPTRSISNPTRILVNGNIIADNCCVKYMGDNLADHFDIINIRDDGGKSTWPEKNSEEQIDRVLNSISYESAQKEYFNNPMDGGDTFKEQKIGKVPPLRDCKVLIYADPSTSNKDVTSGSQKALVLLAMHGFDFYVVKVFLDTMTNAKFINYMFELYNISQRNDAQCVRAWIENNSLQDPFFEQVLLPLIYKQGSFSSIFLPVTPDIRKKPEKWTRIEGTLEPINRLGHLIFNEDEVNDPHMKRLMTQFKNAHRKQKLLDGVDAVEGGVYILREERDVEMSGQFEIIKQVRTNKI